MALNEEQVKNEMNKMVRFIQQEAHEKANEILAKAQEEFSIEKGTLVQQEKVKIIAASERRIKQVEVQRKINYSNRLNQSRLKILQARDQVVESIFQEARSRLNQIVTSPVYKPLISKLILQALYLCMEKQVTLICKKQDLTLVQSVIPEAIAIYKRELGLKSEVDVQVSTTEFLPDDIAGGIVASALNGRIRLTNTLDARLDLLSQEMLPDIRTMLFGANKNRGFYA
jgi:V-type H+-transporting ATPase subunit E